MKQAFNHPVTKAAINAAFGADLRQQGGDQDLGYINVQLGAEGMAGVYKITEEPAQPLPEVEKSEYDLVPIDAWHTDQTPVVLVLMLSDTSPWSAARQP